MRRDVASGIALIAGSLGMVLVVGLHPTAHGLLDASQFAHEAHRNVLAHGLAFVAVSLLFLGLLGLSRALEGDDLSTAALVVWGFGAAAVISAAVMSGFVATEVIERMLAAEGPSRDVYHALLSYTGWVNQGFAMVNVVASAVAIVLWSAAMLRTGRVPRAAGIAGVVVAALLLAAPFTAHLGLGVRGFGIVTTAQSAWLIWLGVLLCRGERRSPGAGA